MLLLWQLMSCDITKWNHYTDEIIHETQKERCMEQWEIKHKSKNWPFFLWLLMSPLIFFLTSYDFSFRNIIFKTKGAIQKQHTLLWGCGDWWVGPEWRSRERRRSDFREQCPPGTTMSDARYRQEWGGGRSPIVT